MLRTNLFTHSVAPINAIAVPRAIILRSTRFACDERQNKCDEKWERSVRLDDYEKRGKAAF
jgi:hypothetical protein